MKKVIVFIMMLICCLFAACGSNNFSRQTDNDSVFGANVYTYTDPDTNVDYLVFVAGYKGGICPRYNADGSLYVENGDN